jgi:ABC-type transporter Mla subunit MlaD
MSLVPEVHTPSEKEERSPNRVPNIFNYLAALLTHGQDHGSQLHRMLHNQRIIMAQLADVQQKLDALTSKVGEIAPALESIGAGITNVAADIQALKDQIGTAPVGITSEEADGVVASLDTTLSNLGTAVEGLQSAAASLQTVADAQ